MAGRISLCMIVKNEERLLAHCLQSVQAIIDEAIVVDTGSSDATVEIAEANGAVVHHMEWCDDFSAARNESLRHATGDWILVLDGDEVLDEEAAEVLAGLDLEEPAAEAFELEVVNYATDELRLDAALFQQQVRLFRRRDRHRYVGRVHNQLVDTDTGQALAGPFVEARVHHYGYTPGVWTEQNKAARLSLMEWAVQEAPEDAFARYNLATHLKILERFDDALEHYAFVLENTPLPPIETWQRLAWISAAFCANSVEQHLEAIDWCDRLLAVEPHCADAHQRRAEGLMALGRFEEAATALGALLSDPERWAVKQQSLAFGVPYGLGRALFQLSRFEEARPHFEALAAVPSRDPTVYTHLAICRAAAGDLPGGRAAAGRARAAGAPTSDLENVAGVIDDVARQLLEGPPVTETGLRLLPPESSVAPHAHEDPEPGFQVLVAQHLASGDALEALNVLAGVLEKDPTNGEAHGELGVILFANGLVDQAIGHFLQAADLQPENISAMLNMLEACWEGRASEAALLRLERALRARSPLRHAPVSTGEPLSVLLIGEGLGGLDAQLSAMGSDVFAVLPTAATDLPPADIYHVAGPLDLWPDIPWDDRLNPANTLVQNDGSLDGERWRTNGFTVVDSALPPTGSGRRLEPIFDGGDVEPLIPFGCLRIFGADQAHHRELKDIVLGLDIEVEVEGGEDAMLGCHGIWRPTSAEQQLTAMALGMAVFTDEGPADRLHYPDRPTLQANVESLRWWIGKTDHAVAVATASRAWVLQTYGIEAVHPQMIALYHLILSR